MIDQYDLYAWIREHKSEELAKEIEELIDEYLEYVYGGKI